MAHSARQNDSFGKVKWAVLKCKMGHSASAKNVKKIQVLCFQCFRKLSKFAYFRPQDFNFRIIDSQSTFFDFFVKIIQNRYRRISSAATGPDRGGTSHIWAGHGAPLRASRRADERWTSECENLVFCRFRFMAICGKC